jgi:hypothetical protein
LSSCTKAATVAELVETTALGRAALRAGAGGVGHEVQRVQWMVLDDFADYLAPGDLLLTTAYNLGDDPVLQRTLASRMRDAGVVAMVVKCGYYLSRCPTPCGARPTRSASGLRAAARGPVRRGLAVDLRAAVSALRAPPAVGRHPSGARAFVVDGADLGTVVRRVAALLGNPVVVEDDAGRALAGWRADGARTGSAPAASHPRRRHSSCPSSLGRHARPGGLIPERDAQPDDVRRSSRSLRSSPSTSPSPTASG